MNGDEVLPCGDRAGLSGWVEGGGADGKEDGAVYLLGHRLFEVALVLGNHVAHARDLDLAEFALLCRALARHTGARDVGVLRLRGEAAVGNHPVEGAVHVPAIAALIAIA